MSQWDSTIAPVGRAEPKYYHDPVTQLGAPNSGQFDEDWQPARRIATCCANMQRILVSSRRISSCADGM